MITGMEFKIGELIRQERQGRGWDQATLARELGDVGQQTISRWERGLSRPRRNMVARLASTFGLEVDDLLKASGFVTPTADNPGQVRRPVRPRLTLLPVADLAPDRFEELVADVAHHLYPKAHVSRYGSQGHKQYGVDVIAQKGSRTLATFQCKRHAQFGPKDVRDAVSAVGIKAREHILVLTRTASPECRKEIATHSGFSLWDIEDLSRVIRTRLQADAAIRIVDTYFPGWREALLGVSEPGPWLTAEEFFRPFRGAQVYTHEWQLVGRSDELGAIAAFVSEGEGPLGMIVGRGGIGKTRLLKAVAERAEGQTIATRFVSGSTELKSEHFELLPTYSALLVVIDDAHDRADLANVVAGIVRARPSARVLAALRPYGLSSLALDFRRLGLHSSEVQTWTLTDLKTSDAETLARNALGPELPERMVRRLAAVTADCPLITVVGGVLIRRGKLDPACLDHEDRIRSEILRAFRDALVADPVSGDPALRRAVLDGVAVLQPFRGDDPAFQSALASLIKAPFDRAVGHLKGLEDAGVLLRRGSSLRIVPDLLGDVILAEACFDERSGGSTGYVERARATSEGEPLQHIFVNATRIDWHVRHDRAEAPHLAVGLWDAVEQELRSAGIRGRRNLLQLLRKVAYFEPGRILGIARWVMDNPTDALEEIDEVFGRLYAPSYADVLQDLPPLLQAASYNIEFLPAAADLLWQLAQQDTRPTNQHPAHALRVLRDLAEYQIGKPLRVNELILAAAERWLSDGRSEWTHSPFEVLEPLLATEGTDDRFESFRIYFTPFAINMESVGPLRHRVIGLALREITATDPRRAVRAVEAIEEAVRYPAGMFGRQIPDSERDDWTSGFMVTIEQVGEIASDKGLDPAVAIAVRKALSWHANYSRTPTREAARRALKRLPKDPRFQLALHIYDGWGHLTQGRTNDYQKAEKQKQLRMQALADALISQYTDDELVELLTERLISQTRAFESTGGNAGPFVWTLVATKPSIGAMLCAQVVRDPGSLLLQVLSVALAALAESAPLEAMRAVEALIKTGTLEVRRGVAQALGWNRGSRSALLENELEIIRALAHDKDPFVRCSIVRAAQRLAGSHLPEAIELIAEIPFADSERVAEELFSVLGPQGELRWQQLPRTKLDCVVEQLRTCPSIEDYHVTAFLAALSEENPILVADLLKKRVEHNEELDSGGDYRALPFHWDHALKIRGHQHHPNVLRDICIWIAAKPDSWHRQEMGADLFKEVAQGFDQTVMTVLDEAIAGVDAAQLGAVVAILHKAPRHVIFDEVDFVRRVLEAGSRFGDEHVQRVGGAFHSAVTSGVRSGIPGEPFREDLDQRDRSAEIAGQLPRGSLEERFYRSLQESAEQSIRWHADHHEREADGRDW